MNCNWIRRPDLISTPHENGGWVVKDPITLQFALLSEAEFHVLQLLDGRHSVGEILTQAAASFPSVAFSRDTLAGFLQQLAASQLIRAIVPGESQRLTPSTKSFGQRLAGGLFGILRIHIRLLNPQPLLDRVLSSVRHIPVEAVGWTLTLLIVAAVAVGLTQARLIAADLPSLSDFVGPQNLLSLLLIFIFVKTLHELGHALIARWFGAECHECGILLMVFTPVLYTNVTDTWRLSKRQRMAVTAAGIAVELVIAAICLLLWQAAAPGWTRSMLLNTALLCSINTLLFNGNPLLRFDGYFLLSDALQIPNLAGRSSALLQNATVRLLTGSPAPPQVGSKLELGILWIYGLLATAYRLLLTIAILRLVDEVSRTWNLQIVGRFLSLVVLIGLLVVPAARLLQKTRQAVHQQPNRRWAIGRAILVTAAVIAALRIPLPQTVVAPASVQPTAVAMYASVPGRLQQFVRYGQLTSKQECVVILQNDQLQQTQATLASDLKRLQTELSLLTDNPATANSALIPTLRESITSATIRLREFEAEVAALCVHAETDGMFLPPPIRPQVRKTDLPEFWHGLPATESNRGAWIERGTLLGYVGQPTDIEVHVALTENEVEFVQPAQTVSFAVAGVQQIFDGQIVDVSSVPTEELPRSLMVAGLVDGRLQGQTVQPADVTYLATVKLQLDVGNHQAMGQSSTLPPPLYAAGRVRIQTAATSLWQRAERYLRQTF